MSLLEMINQIQSNSMQSNSAGAELGPAQPQLVDQKYRDYILNPDAIPVGWTSRRYYPPRAKRPPAADLHPAKVPNTRQTALLQTAASLREQTLPVAGDNNFNQQ